MAFGSLAWSAFWFALLAAIFVVMFFLIREMYRIGRRRGGGWWAAVFLAGVALIALPIIGWIAAVAVILVERSTPPTGSPLPPPQPPGLHDQRRT